MTGKTVDAAKEAALDQLGVAEGDAELIVVSEPKAGLFGRMRGEARVRARVRPVGPRPKRQRRAGKDRGRAGNGGRSGSGGGAGGGRGGRNGGPADGPAGGGNGSRSRGAGPSAAEAGGPGSGGDGSPGDGVGKSRSARRRRSRSRARLAGTDTAAAGSGTGEANGDDGTPERSGGGRAGNGRHEDNGRRPRTKEEPEMVEGVTLEEQAAVAREFLEGLLDQYGFEASVETRVLDEETVELAADGEGLGMLVGPKGATLAALQDVTRTVVQRRFPNRTGPDPRGRGGVPGAALRSAAPLHPAGGGGSGGERLGACAGADVPRRPQGGARHRERDGRRGHPLRG